MTDHLKFTESSTEQAQRSAVWVQFAAAAVSGFAAWGNGGDSYIPDADIPKRAAAIANAMMREYDSTPAL